MNNNEIDFIFGAENIGYLARARSRSAEAGHDIEIRKDNRQLLKDIEKSFHKAILHEAKRLVSLADQSDNKHSSADDSVHSPLSCSSHETESA